MIEKLGKKSFGEYASLTVIEFNVYPGKTVHIHEYDGYESVKLIDGNYKSTLTLCPNAEAIYQEFVKEYNTRIKPCKSGTDIYFGDIQMGKKNIIVFVKTDIFCGIG